jgi:hypothetical protein
MRPFSYWIRIATPSLKQRGVDQKQIFTEASKLWKAMAPADKASIVADAARVKPSTASRRVTHLEQALYTAQNGHKFKLADVTPERLATLHKKSRALIREAKIRAGLMQRQKASPIIAYTSKRVGEIMKAEKIPLGDAGKKAAAEFKALPASAKKAYGGKGHPKVFAPHEEQMIASLVAKFKGGQGESPIAIARAARKGKRPSYALTVKKAPSDMKKAPSKRNATTKQ